MTKAGFWRADRFPGSAIALLLLRTSRSTVIQSLDRGANESGLRITKRLASGCIGAIQIADHGIAASRAQVSRTGFDTANEQRGGREAVGRSR